MNGCHYLVEANINLYFILFIMFCKMPCTFILVSLKSLEFLRQPAKRIIKMYHRFRYIFNPRKMCSHLIFDSDNIPPQWLVVLVLIRVVRSPESGNSLKTFIIHANCTCLGILLILTVNNYDFSPSFKFHPN